MQVFYFIITIEVLKLILIFLPSIATGALPNNVPQILINREPLRHMVFDVELLGDCDIIVNQLCHM